MGVCVGPSAHCSKANTQAMLMERKMGFTLNVGNWQGRVETSVQRTPHHPSRPWSFYRQKCRGCIQGLHAETAQSALTVIFRLAIRWSDRHHLDCFRSSSSLVPGSVCSHFFEAIFRNCGSLGHGYSLVIMELTSSTWGFSICETAHRIWLRILSIVLEKELKVLDYA